MLDLNKLEKEINKLFETETSDSLTKWLLNKRFGKINILLENGNFISMKRKKITIFSTKSNSNFISKNNIHTTGNPINRQAA